eukprot:Tamp_15396.p1 GENE.Tamp_15396~~Tamp_15396.p1  ORF type:complete len:480 (+),score=95.13 Tamp_15396:119-1441(+)
MAPSALGAPAVAPASAPALNDTEQEVLAKCFKGALVSFYTRFPSLRAGLRHKVGTCLVAEVYQCQQISASSMGVRLHALDGGARNSSISLVGAVAALEVMTGMVRGLRKPVTSEQHLKLLRDCLLLLHEPNTMIDDRTPLLELFHKPLCLALVAFVECAPQVATELLRAVVSYWPTSASANSSKEVLLLHEIELVLEHCPPEALADLTLRNLLIDTMTSSFEGSKNFRVAERALLAFRSDGVLNVLRQHHVWCVSVLVPKLLQASTDHWNPSVLKLIGTAISVLDEMGAETFEETLGCERASHVRSTALKLNPPEDQEKLAAESAARSAAILRTRQSQDLNLYRLALGHELGVGAYSRVRFGKLIVKELPQHLWPHVAVKIQDKDVLDSQGYAANVQREIRILEGVSHPNIVQFVGSFTSRHATRARAHAPEAYTLTPKP